MICFITIHLARSTLPLLTLLLFFCLCYCCLIHMSITMPMLHPLYGLAGICQPSKKTDMITKSSKKCSKKINLFSSSFASIRGNILPGSFLTTRSLVNLDGRLGNLTCCGLQVLGISVKLIWAFLLLVRIIKTHTCERRGRRQCGFTTLSSSNCSTQSFIKSKALRFITTIVPCLFVGSQTEKSKNILLSIMIFQGRID
jgi:hypothetical protein